METKTFLSKFASMLASFIKVREFLLKISANFDKNIWALQCIYPESLLNSVQIFEIRGKDKILTKYLLKIRRTNLTINFL